jgi:DEAD/DEAH box helicase domain-containing protein
MGPEHVITSRETQRLNPPDVLLTNYKMLDYLLTRPSDAKLWRYNKPETLRYLVVDELHTFDGAQGTDLACLLRRLKDRLDTPEGHLCCVGTSATLGGIEDFGDLRSYTEDVFGEPFDEGAVIGEQRTAADSFLRPAQHEEIPGPADREALDPEAYDTPEAYLRGQVPLWLGTAASSDAASDAGRVQLGEALRGHSFLRDLLDVLDGPRSMGVLADELAEQVPVLQGTSETHRRALLQSFLSLLSWARSPVELQDGETEIGPFVQLRSQLWLRELRRMVASIDEDPELLFWDDLPDTSSRDPHLPLAHCLECGAMGWVGIHRQNERRFRDDLKDIYRRYFNDEPTYSFAFPAESTEEISAEGSRHQLCGYDLHFSDPDAKACDACGRKDRLLSVFRPHNRKTTNDGTQIGSNDCPFCDTRGGLTIVGSRAASLTSVLISQLFASAHNEDKSLLTFSDSVQDAATGRASSRPARTASTCGVPSSSSLSRPRNRCRWTRCRKPWPSTTCARWGRSSSSPPSSRRTWSGFGSLRPCKSEARSPTAPRSSMTCAAV